MRIDEMTGMDQVGAHIAKMGIDDPIKRLVLKLGIFFQSPNLHDVFLEWIEVYCKDNAKAVPCFRESGIDVETRDMRFKIEQALQLMGLDSYNAENQASDFCHVIPSLQAEFFPEIPTSEWLESRDAVFRWMEKKMSE